MTIADRIRARRIELGMTQDELARKIGYKDRASITRIESGERRIKQDMVVPLSKALELSPAQLLGWDAESEELEGTVALSVEQKEVPILGYVAAGKNIFAEENVIGSVRVEPKMWGELFALRIKGDSMSPRIMDGDTVIVRKQEDAESGQIVIAVVNGEEGVCKRLIKFNGGIVLQSLNPAYEPMTFTDEQIKALPVTIVGRVIQNRCDF